MRTPGKVHKMAKKANVGKKLFAGRTMPVPWTPCKPAWRQNGMLRLRL